MEEILFVVLIKFIPRKIFFNFGNACKGISLRFGSEKFFPLGNGEAFEHPADVAEHERIEGIEGDADAVVGDAVLRKVVGAYALS